MTMFRYPYDWSAAEEVKPNVRQVKFGDGYEQRQANGINTMPRNWSLSFALRDDGEAEAIETFLEARRGVEAFDWIDPRGKQGRYVCRSWRRVKDRYNLNTITCAFEQVFEAA